MKEFNLDEYLKNPSQKVVTRDGREVRIICTDAKGEYPIMALIPDKQEELTYRYLRNGRQLTYKDSPLDLFFSTIIKKEGWVNLYRNEDVVFLSEKIYKSKEDAKEVAIKKTDYIATIKIEWEE